MPDGFSSLPFGECEPAWKNVRGRRVATKLFSFSNLFFPIFFSFLSLVSRRCVWGRPSVWNSSFRSKNGELGPSVGFWNRLSAPWTCIIRYLKMVHGATQREPRVWFSVKNDGHQSAATFVFFISTRSTSSRRDYPSSAGDLGF